MTAPIAETVSPKPRLVDRIRELGTAQRKSIVVPEWGDAELFFSRMTIADMRAVADRDPKDNYARNIILLIFKAQDVDGNTVFTMGDRHWLESESDYMVTQRVINFMFEAAMPPGALQLDGKEPKISDQAAIGVKKEEIASTPTGSSVTS